MHNVEFALYCAVVAWTARNILMDPGSILDWYFYWLDDLHLKGRRKLAKALGLCSWCLAGQISLWAGLLYFSEGYAAAPIRTAAQHIFSICLSVWITYQMDRLKHE